VSSAEQVEAQVAELRRGLALAQQQGARAEQEKAVAQAGLETTMRTLNEQFGVDSPEAAQALIRQLEAELEAELGKARANMEKAGA
jgi:hypothetical protein